MPKTLVIFLLILFAGCQQQTPTDTQKEIPPQTSVEPLPIAELPAKHQPPMVANAQASNDVASAEETPELSHLFSTAWFADHDSTKQYNIVTEPSGDFAKLHCDQYPVEMFFKDEGMSWKTKLNGKTIIPVDFKSEKFKRDFKQIDKTHLAVRVGEHWLVFSSNP